MNWFILSSGANVGYYKPNIEHMKPFPNEMQSRHFWCNISRNSYIPFEVYINNKDYAWEMTSLLGNINFTYEKIKDYPEDILYWSILSLKGPDDIIKNNLNNCNLDYRLFVRNTNVSNDTLLQVIEIAKVNEKVHEGG